MLAAVLHAFGDLRVEQVADPHPGPTEVLLDVACVQPSVTEAMLVDGEPVVLHEHLAERLAAGPVAWGGHEFAAVVNTLGSQVSGLEVGQRVVVIETVHRGRSRQYLGFTTAGAFAEQVVVPAENIVPLPPTMSAARAAAIQPLCGALHAQERAGVRPGETVLVVGCGVMGLHAIQLARLEGAGRVIAVGRSAHKRRLAEELGADVVLENTDEVLSEIDRITDGHGADVVIETAAGAASAGLSGDATVDLAARAAAFSGRIVLVSVLGDDARLPLGVLRNKALTLLHPSTGTLEEGLATFRHAVQLVDTEQVRLDPMITHSLRGIESVPRAVELVRRKPHRMVNPPQVHTAHSWDDPDFADDDRSEVGGC